MILVLVLGTFLQEFVHISGSTYGNKFPELFKRSGSKKNLPALFVKNRLLLSQSYLYLS